MFDPVQVEAGAVVGHFNIHLAAFVKGPEVQPSLNRLAALEPAQIDFTAPINSGHSGRQLPVGPDQRIAVAGTRQFNRAFGITRDEIVPTSGPGD